jgi:hypothetical protein
VPRFGKLFFPADMETTMGSHGLLAGSILVAVACAAASAQAQQKPAPPDFSSNHVGWAAVARGPTFAAVPGQLPPVTSDPAHPYVPNGTGNQPSFRIGDLSNPNLKPWVKEQMKRDNDGVLAGKLAFTARAACMPAGVPGFMAFGGADEPIFIIQTPKQVWMIYQGNQEVRRIYLDAPHSEDLKPSWYGESVGHYEGDTPVIDTIGQNDRTFLDFFRTPHTEKVHVVERWRLVESGRIMEVIFTVDDSDAFYAPWTGMRRYRHVEQEMVEEPCAENNQHVDSPVPIAQKPDF